MSGPVAPLVIDGAVRGDIFLAWTEQHLIKELHAGDIVIMDNLEEQQTLFVIGWPRLQIAGRHKPTSDRSDPNSSAW